MLKTRRTFVDLEVTFLLAARPSVRLVSSSLRSLLHSRVIATSLEHLWLSQKKKADHFRGRPAKTQMPIDSLQTSIGILELPTGFSQIRRFDGGELVLQASYARYT
jgi:hypothetical protein